MRTQSLFHFTKSLDVLFQIIEHGFWPRYCFEDIGWVNENEKFYGLPMVCFCDISLPKLGEHTSFYGRFGLGMTRSWGIKNKLNPLMYISEGSVLSQSLHQLMLNPDPSNDELRKDSLITLGHTKPLSGQMIVGGKTIEKNFYEECEWRYVDISKGGVFPSDINDENSIEKFNEATRENSLMFEPSDIRYLLVEKESDVAPTVDFINTKLGKFSHNSLKILSTKIIALDELQSDI